MKTTASTIRLYIRSEAAPQERKFQSRELKIGQASLARIERAPLGAPDGLQWHSLTVPIHAGVSAWDAAHAAAMHISTTHKQNVYVEPDIEQQNFRGDIPSPPKENPDEPDPLWPPLKDSLSKDWHLDFSQLRSARRDPDVLRNAVSSPIRIGHLDTGYNPQHESLPQRLLMGLAWNVLDDKSGAIDPADYSGLLQNPGHGTATLALLAGGFCSRSGDLLGGAPMCEILPVRISDSVVHIWTSVIAKGINYALDNGCHVISLSHGGLPTQAWADAVNRAYDMGTVICAASGDSIGGFPMTDVVWPARFRRAISVCGVTADSAPYFDPKFDGTDELEGNFGPKRVMGNAIAAYTPNVLWAKIKDWPDATEYSKNGYQLSGSGTSASTPQVAAAAALYLQKNYAALMTLPGPKRVEAIRSALFSSAKPANDILHFGCGFLRANDALALPVTAPAKTLDDDEIAFALLAALPGWNELTPDKQQMFNVEATQVVFSSGPLMRIMKGADGDISNLDGRTIKKLVAALQNAHVSNALKEFLNDAMAKLR